MDFVLNMCGDNNNNNRTQIIRLETDLSKLYFTLKGHDIFHIQSFAVLYLLVLSLHHQRKNKSVQFNLLAKTKRMRLDILHTHTSNFIQFNTLQFKIPSHKTRGFIYQNI